MDKFTDVYSIKIPHPLKHHLDELPAEIKKELNRELRLQMERYIHKHHFKAGMYSGADDSNE